MRFTDRAIENVKPRDQRFIVWADGYRGVDQAQDICGRGA